MTLTLSANPAVSRLNQDLQTSVTVHATDGESYNFQAACNILRIGESERASLLEPDHVFRTRVGLRLDEARHRKLYPDCPHCHGRWTLVSERYKALPPAPARPPAPAHEPRFEALSSLG